MEEVECFYCSTLLNIKNKAINFTNISAVFINVSSTAFTFVFLPIFYSWRLTFLLPTRVFFFILLFNLTVSISLRTEKSLICKIGVSN